MAQLVLAGCGGLSSNATPVPSITPAATTSPTPVLYTVTMLVCGEMPPPDSPVLTELQAAACVNLSIRAVNHQGYAAALQIELSSDHRYDLVDITPAQGYPYRDLFLDVRPLFERGAPSYMSWVLEIGLWDDIADESGRIGVFPARADTRRIDGGWWVRGDLAGMAGDPAALFATARKDGIVGLSVPGGVIGLMGQIAPLFGVPADVYMSGGTRVYGPVTGGFRNALAWLSERYADGSLDPAFAVRDKAGWRSLAATSRMVAAMCGFEDWEGLADCGYALCAPPQVSPEPKINTLSGHGVGWMALSSRCPDPGAVTRLIEFCFSARGQLLMNYGVDGIHSRVFKEYAVLAEPWKSSGLEILRGQGLFARAIPGILFAEENALSPGLRDTALWLRASYLFAVDTIYDDPAVWSEEAELRLLVQGQLIPAAQRWWTDFIMGKRDVHTDWNEYVGELDQVGLGDLIEG